MGTLNKLKTAYSISRSGAKGWQSYLWNTSMARMGLVGPLLPPVYIGLEPTNVCNAQCPVCETGKGEMKRNIGMLKMNDFQRFINQVHSTTNTLMLYFMGETFLNKNAYDMIRYAREKNIYVETCTNGDYVDPKGVIYSDINKISFQLGGMTEETNSRYRVRSVLAKTKNNLMNLIEERKKNPQSNVQIEVGFIVMRHNEHEVNEFMEWANEVGVDIANIIDPCVRNMMEGYAYLPRNPKYWYYDKNQFDRGKLVPAILPDNECAWIWNSVVINWDGDVVPCCRDPNGTHVLGNVFEEDIKVVFNSKSAREFRRKILHNQREVDICQLCSGYGLPTMVKGKPMGFEIQRHTFNSDDLIISEPA